MLRTSLCAPSLFHPYSSHHSLQLHIYQCIRASQLHTTPIFRDDNHYQTLQISGNASAADIKRQFYHLSKKHHPDHNRNDPNASQRFVKISEAYAILGSPTKREQYDRQIFRSSSNSDRGSGNRSSSYSSTGPVGGRPASGLSRRRTQFRGPPPSFYRNGAWGSYARKRQAQANATAAAAAAAAAAHNARAAQAEEMKGGNRSNHPNEKNFENEIYNDEELSYFDRAGHYRTQQQQEGRRRMNRRGLAEEIPHINTEPPPSLLRSFLLVGGILTLSMGISSVFTGVFSDSPKKR